MDEFLEWLKENKISVNGKYKGKRWGSVTKLEHDEWHIRICVQYDEFLDTVLLNETIAMQELVKMHTGHGECGRCIEGKCAFTGFDLVNPTKEQIELAKKLIIFRINAIKDGRIPKCSYIKIAKRGEALEPCAVCKVCDPKCKAIVINAGDGAFYGPKIDFHLEDSIGRTWQCGTIQLDFQLPQRFQAEYVGADGNKHRPIMIHRVVFGSIERFMGILIEHFAGKFPLWLSPVQVKVLPISDKYIGYAKEIEMTLKKEEFRCETAPTVSQNC